MTRSASNLSAWRGKRAYGGGLPLIIGITTATLVPELAFAQEQGTQLEEITVEGSRPETSNGLIGATPGYGGQRAVSSTKLDTPQRDVPQVVTIAPREVINDLNATRVDRVFNYTPGVAQQNNFGGLTVFSYAVRGVTTSEIYRNGFAINRGFPPPPDTQNVERIEVLKGAGGTLFGRSDPGGLVNIVTKQPTATRFIEFGGLFGSFGQYRGTLDAGGSLNEDNTLLYRLNVAGGEQGSFRDFVDSDRVLVAPVVSWQLTPDTKVTVETEFVRNRVVFDRGVIAVNGRLGVIPFSRFLGEPGQSTFQNNNTMQVRLEHRFNEDWNMRLATHLNTGDLRGESAEIRAIAPNGRTVSRDRNFRDYRWDVFIGQAEVTGRFATGPLDHQVLFGIEQELTDSRTVYNRSNFRTAPFSLDIHNPVYSQPLPPLTIFRNNIERVTSTALYAQDQITFSPQWKALVGVRLDTFDQDFRERIPPSLKQQSIVNAAPRAGLVYQPIPELSLYTNVGTSFRPNIGPDAAAVTGGTLLDGALSLTGTAFRIERENVLTSDPNNSGFSLAAGGVRSQGFEFTAAGQVTPELKILGGYVFTDAEITKDNVLPVGAPLINVPTHSGSLLAVYEVQAGPLAGLGVGGGVRGVGARAADAAGTGFTLPAYVTADALAYYRHGNVRLGLNVENVFDARYYESSLNAFRVYPGSPRRVTGSISLRF
jgi:iron complex outermembrane receptor protein